MRLVLATLLLLQACASVPPAEPSASPPAGTPQVFAMQGRVSVQYGDQSLSGQLHWVAEAASDEVLLSSPLGQGVAGISRNNQGVRLTRPGEPPVMAENVEDLTQSVLGFRLPLAGLRYWMQAKPDPARHSVVRLDAGGGVERIVQDGWQIDYPQYDQNRPRKIHVTREGLEIRLVIDEWRVN